MPSLLPGGFDERFADNRVTRAEAADLALVAGQGELSGEGGFLADGAGEGRPEALQGGGLVIGDALRPLSFVYRYIAEFLLERDVGRSRPSAESGAVE